MKTKIFLLTTFLLNCVHAFSQRDLDLITLKNGNQLLGYIIEQRPGKSISIVRYTLHDTITAQMDDIDFLSKILVQTFNEKKSEKKDSAIGGKDSIINKKNTVIVKSDSIIGNKDSVKTIGRFNNKKNIFQFGYAMIASNFYAGVSGFVPGGSIAYYRSFNNIYFAGVSLSAFNANQKSEALDGKSYYDKSIVQVQLIAENKLRLNIRPQNKRLAVLLGLNAGYIFNNSRSWVFSSDVPSLLYEEKILGNFMLQTNLCFKINSGENSGFTIEPVGFIYYKPVIEKYNLYGNYLENRRSESIYYTFRLGYFF